MPKKSIKNMLVKSVKKRQSEENKSYTSLLYGVLTVVVLFLIVLIGSKLLINRHKEGEITPEAASTQAQPKTSPYVYKVEEGDSLWTIAVAKYNDGYQWTQIATANKLENPNIITPGQKLTIPKSTLEQEAEKKLTGNTYTVVRGDSLWDVAVRAYGDGYKWPDIAALNNLDNPNLIHAGNVLKLPR